MCKIYATQVIETTNAKMSKSDLTSRNSATSIATNATNHDEDMMSSLKRNDFISSILQTPNLPACDPLQLLDDFSLPSTEEEGLLRHRENQLRRLAVEKSAKFQPCFTEYKVPDDLYCALRSPLVTDQTSILLPLASHVIVDDVNGGFVTSRRGLEEARREICRDVSPPSSDESLTELIDEGKLSCLKIKKKNFKK